MRNEIKKFCAIAMIALMAMVCRSAQVESVLVRQQWPWNAEVRVEYVVSGATAPAAVTFEFRNGGEVVPISDATALKGDHLWAGNGTHVVTFDPRALFGPAAPNEFTAFTASVTLGAENAAMGDKLYRIVDLETGAVEDLVRGDFLNGKYGAYETAYSAIDSTFSTTLSDVLIWTDVTNTPLYRTTKMVLRRIQSENVEWLMGTNTPGVTLGTKTANIILASPHLVKLTSDYYMGVFEVTQMQYKKIMGSYSGSFKNEENYPDHEEYPASGIPYNTCRGQTKYWTVDGHEVSDGTYMAALRAKTGGTIAFDLPTEAQWEFACRGGNYIPPLYSGKAYGMNSLKELGWCSDNAESKIYVVGKKPPNAYGLYDMYGNVQEWCLDWSNAGDYAWTSKTEPEVDPQGIPFPSITLTSGGNGNHIVRGGAYSLSRTVMHSAFRAKYDSSDTGSALGFRVCCPAN